jgi:hypothetical protein
MGNLAQALEIAGYGDFLFQLLGLEIQLAELGQESIGPLTIFRIEPAAGFADQHQGSGRQAIATGSAHLLNIFAEQQRTLIMGYPAAIGLRAVGAGAGLDRRGMPQSFHPGRPAVGRGLRHLAWCAHRSVQIGQDSDR